MAEYNGCDYCLSVHDYLGGNVVKLSGGKIDAARDFHSEGPRADAFDKLPNLKRWFDEINARPAAQRAEALKDRQSYKTDFDADALKVLFPQNARLAQSAISA